MLPGFDGSIAKALPAAEGQSKCHWRMMPVIGIFRGPFGSSRHTPCAVKNSRHMECAYHKIAMAGFKTHITVSTITGVGYGVWGFYCGAPLETCVLAGGLCSV